MNDLADKNYFNYFIEKLRYIISNSVYHVYVVSAFIYSYQFVYRDPKSVTTGFLFYFYFEIISVRQGLSKIVSFLLFQIWLLTIIWFIKMLAEKKYGIILAIILLVIYMLFLIPNDTALLFM